MLVKSSVKMKGGLSLPIICCGAVIFFILVSRKLYNNKPKLEVYFAFVPFLGKRWSHMKTRVLVFVAAIGVLAGFGTVPDASAELSQGFRNNLQKQYESGHIPDPNKNMSYEERLAIRKKQQKLEEEQQRNKAFQPTPSPPPRNDDGYGRQHERQRSDDRYADPYEQRYRDCQHYGRPGSGEFSRCMRENRDRYDNDNRYDDDGRNDDIRPRRY